jgi:hypothetical protein
MVAAKRLLIAVDPLDHNDVLGGATGARCGVRERRHGGGLLEPLAAGAHRSRSKAQATTALSTWAPTPISR